MKYEVTFTQSYTYAVEATNEDEAIEMAIEEFEDEMREPIANTYYDDLFIEEVED